jgi:hypothetical protein
MKKLAFAAICIMLSNCGTIMHGTTQKVNITSEPSGARVMIDNNFVGVTPVTVDLARKFPHTAKFALDGYKPANYTFQKAMSPAIVGNLFTGLIPGLLVDFSTGGGYELSADQITAVMKENE